jgi:cytochrome c oxidase cbb3-type subunit 4
MIGGIVTAALLVVFIGGWIWAWSPKRKRAFDEAARLPLEDDGAYEAVEQDKRGNAA